MVREPFVETGTGLPDGATSEDADPPAVGPLDSTGGAETPFGGAETLFGGTMLEVAAGEPLGAEDPGFEPAAPLDATGGVE